jgi:SNF2 family DNA or RNA helicase
MQTNGSQIEISYDSLSIRGEFHLVSAMDDSSVWERIIQRALAIEADYELSPNVIRLPWTTVLTLIREFAPSQRRDSFQFRPMGDAKGKIVQFVQELNAVKASRGTLTVRLSQAEIEERLISAGFTKRTLRDFQIDDVQQLLTLANGANFSVPGAGKTTVSLALHLLTRTEETRLLVVAPKNAFLAWQQVVQDCMDDSKVAGCAEPFTILRGGSDAVEHSLETSGQRFLITYDQLVRIPNLISTFLARNRVHLILDESHRMKGGVASLRGATLLNMSSLPVRRDILSGTPMPQAPSDLQSQLDFLWPGGGLGAKIGAGTAPRQVLGNLYVRTTKSQLGLPKRLHHFLKSDMNEGQLALYSIVRSELLKQLSRFKSDRRVDLFAARRSVMTLLQLSSNPLLALRSMAETNELSSLASGVVTKVIEEGPSQKMRDVAARVRELALQGRKTVVWTIFTGTITEMERMLADLNPVTLYGEIPTGDDDDADTREGRIKRFHNDPACMVMIANPAAAGEGISLHTVCHDAIYLDRSYNTTHYLQSIDRIHRLGLSPGIETNIYIYQSVAPKGIGSIDGSVNRRLAVKLRNLQQLLDDPDLHEVALDEENASDPTDYGIEIEDIVDLIEVLEKGETPAETEEED